MRLAILAITNGGKKLGQSIASQLSAEYVQNSSSGMAHTIAELWNSVDGLICIMATGIVVRAIAPLVHDKKSDPCVVVVDEAGQYAISLLSGHLGGGNSLAERVALCTGGQAVITTASDILGHTPIDLWARHNKILLDATALKTLSAKLVNNRSITVASTLNCILPKDFHLVASGAAADSIISDELLPDAGAAVIITPRSLIVGIGCNRGTPLSQIEAALQMALEANRLSFDAIAGLATIDLKSDERGLVEFADKHGLTLHFYRADELNDVPAIERSAAVFNATGAYAVCEPAALLCSQAEKLLLRKTKWKDVTIAIARKPQLIMDQFQ